MADILATKLNLVFKIAFGASAILMIQTQNWLSVWKLQTCSRNTTARLGEQMAKRKQPNTSHTHTHPKSPKAYIPKPHAGVHEPKPQAHKL